MVAENERCSCFWIGRAPARHHYDGRHTLHARPGPRPLDTILPQGALLAGVRVVLSELLRVGSLFQTGAVVRLPAANAALVSDGYRLGTLGFQVGLRVHVSAPRLRVVQLSVLRDPHQVVLHRPPDTQPF